MFRSSMDAGDELLIAKMDIDWSVSGSKVGKGTVEFFETVLNVKQSRFR